MPIRIELRTRSGDVQGVTGEAYDTVQHTIPELSPSRFPLLSGVSRYEDTMFNSLQMDRLPAEIEQLMAESPHERLSMLTKLIELCRAGSMAGDHQLWFIGD